MSTEADARKVLKHIARFLTIAVGYQDDEEERLALAFVTLATHHLTDEIISDWLYSLDRSLREKGQTIMENCNHTMHNFLLRTF